MSNKPYFEHASGQVVYDVNTKENLAEFKVSQFYINDSNEDIVVMHRNNLPIRISPNNSGFKRGKTITIRSLYAFQKNNIIVDTANDISKLIDQFPNVSEDLLIIKTALINSYNSDRFVNHCTVAIDRHISIDAIKEKGNIYCPESDIMLSFRNIDLLCPHPYSNEGKSISSIVESLPNIKGTNITIDVIDNENNISKRYLYAAKTLLDVTVQRDADRKSGAYITVASSINGEVEIKSTYHSLDKLEDEVGIYKTKEDAISGGDANEVHKNSMLKLQKVVEETKHKHELDLLNSKKELADTNKDLENFKALSAKQKEEMDLRKAEMDEWKRERDEHYSRKAQRRNDHYESASYERKESFEIMKYVPAMVLAAVGTYAAVRHSK